MRLPLPPRDLPGEEVAQIRGEADAMALKLRHHDSKLHQREAPRGDAARAVFDAVEQARCEALGARRMVAVAENLSEVKKNDQSSSTKPTGKGDDVMPGPSGRSVRQIEATGHVRIEKETGNSTSNKAVFDNSRRIVTLTGDPVAWEEGTRVSGEKIIIYLDEDRSVVEGGSHLLIDGEIGGVK